LKRRPPAVRVKRAAKELVLSQPIRFDEASGSPTPESFVVLEEVLDLMARSPDIAHLEVQVHGDNSGDAARDRALTDQRATALRDWLVEHGIAATRLSARGYGSEQPVSPSITPAGRARNRRVKLALTD
jgi:outer membrane protein OmpA-like peptidoglycan-associated protein